MCRVRSPDGAGWIRFLSCASSATKRDDISIPSLPANCCLAYDITMPNAIGGYSRMVCMPDTRIFSVMPAPSETKRPESAGRPKNSPYQVVSACERRQALDGASRNAFRQRSIAIAPVVDFSHNPLKTPVIGGLPIDPRGSVWFNPAFLRAVAA
jgi:hypothetical protein